MTSDMDTFEISDLRSEKPQKDKIVPIFLFIYMIVLTGGLAYLTYREWALQKEFTAFREDFCSLRCPEGSKIQGAFTGGTEGSTIDSDVEEMIYSQNSTSLSAGNWLVAVQEEIHLIHIKNTELNMRINNITVSSGRSGERGPPGIPGERGPPGQKGEEGNIGLVGNPGLPGPSGPPGMDGMKGETGNLGKDGEKGAVGSPGPSGLPGAQGPKGSNGETGMNGAPGSSGTPGGQGEKGQKGDSGFPGQKGDEGNIGKVGTPGLLGLPGRNGEKGEPGPPGQDGQKGSAGSAGIPGNPGAQGATGQQGSKGDNGVTGAPGVPGMAGSKGQKGDQGLNGATGQNGEAGRAGVNGLKGEPGLPGPPGPPGPSGARVTVTIVGGRKGRVEVFYNGEWGTICDDDWDVNDGKVICRMLGYSRVVSTFTATAGTGKIWLDNVRCVGTENNISDCPKTEWEKHDCSHSEDAGVECA